MVEQPNHLLWLHAFQLLHELVGLLHAPASFPRKVKAERAEMRN